MKHHTLLACFALATLAQQTLAEPLTEAKINQIVNDVKVIEPRQGARPAALQDSIKGDLGVATGIQSRAELLFQDNTLTRLGAETFFSFEPGTRNLNLNRGSMLLQVPKDHGGAHIRAASVSASITGTTIMMEYLADNSVKVLVLEGSLRVNMNARPGESMLLRAGKMVVVPANAQALPKPVDVNLHNLVRTSALIDPALFNAKSSASAAPLPSMGLIEKVIAQQSSSGVPLSDATVTAATSTGGTTPSADTTATSSGSTATSTESSSTTTSTSSTSTSTGTTSGTTSTASTGTTAGTTSTASATVPTDTASATASSNPTSTPVGTTTALTTTTATFTTTSTPPSNPATLTSAPPAAPTPSPAPVSTPPPAAPAPPPSTPAPTAPPITGIPAAPLATPILLPPANTNPSPTVVPTVIVSASPYIIGAGTVINTNQNGPSIMTNTVTDAGSVFKSTMSTGSASKFLFGSSSNFDGQMNFDTQFNQQFGNSAVYAFISVELQANPTFTTNGGLNNVALISNGDITPLASSGQSVLSAVQQLFLGTVNGSITINNGLAFGAAANSNLKLLELYARNGSVDFGTPVTLQNGQLLVSAQNDVIIEPTATIAANTASFTGMGNVTFGGTLNQNNIAQFYAGAALTNTGSITTQTFWGSGATANIGGSITANQATLQIDSDLTVGSLATINAQKLYLVAGGLLEVDGTVTASNSLTLDAASLVVQGTLNTPSTLSAAAGTVNIGGTVTGSNTNATYTVTQNFVESAGATITANNLTITAGGGIVLGAVANGSTIALTAGTVPLQTGSIVFNGPITTQQLNANGASVTVNNTIAGQQMTFNTTGDFISQAGGNLSSSGGGQGLTITAGGAITLNGNTAVQTATFTSGSNFLLTGTGAITATGNVLIAAPTLIELDGQISNGAPNGNVTLTLGGSGAVLINGAVQVQSLSTADHSSLQDVTVNGSVTLTKDMNFTDGGNFTVASTGSLNAGGNVTITSAKGIAFNGGVSGNNFNLNTGGNLAINSPLTALGNVTANSNSIALSSNISGGQLAFTVTQDFTLPQGSGLTATQDIDITSTADGVNLDGSTNSKNLTVAASGLITVGGIVQSTGNVQIATGGQAASDVSVSGHVTGASIQMQPLNTLTLTPTGVLNSTGDINLTANQLTLNGQVTGNHVTLGNNQTNTISLNGQIQSQSFQVNGGTGIFTGSVTTSNQDINVNLSSGFTETASASLNSAGHIQVTAASAQISGAMTGTNISVVSSGNLDVNAGVDLQGTGSVALSGLNTTIGGTLSAPTVSVTGSSSFSIAPLSGFISASAVTLNSSGALTLAGAQGGVGGLDMSRLTSLTASGGGLTLENSFLLPTGNSSLTAGSSGIVATGFDLAGFQNITVNNGSYSGESLSANNVQINQSGNLTLTGNLTSTGNVSVAGAVNVAGSLTANNITATTSVSAQSLSVGTLNAASLAVGSGGLTPYSGGASNITAPTITSPLSVLMNGTAGNSTTAPGNGGGLNLTTGSLAVDSSSLLPGTLSAANFNGGDADPTRSDAGGNGGTFNLNSSGDVTVNSPINATTGLNSKTGMTGGNGGTVNVTTSGAITVNSNIQVSSTETSTNSSDNTPRRASRNGGNVNLTSNKTSGTAIAVNNTGQILALLNAASPGKGGTINFTSAGGAINVNGGRVQADGSNSAINIVNNGPNGVVQLTNATLSADVVKVGALGANGQLTVGGGTINANTTLKLYGGTSNGQVTFNDDVNLSGASTKIIAGATVTIASGKTVTVGGNAPANVYTNTANYMGSGGNGHTTGVFGGKGATTSAYINAPAF